MGRRSDLDYITCIDKNQEEYEDKVIGGIFKDIYEDERKAETCYNIIRTYLKPEHFTGLKARRVYENIQQDLDTLGFIDLQNDASYDKEDRDYISTCLKSCITAADTPSYAKRLVDNYRDRTYLKASETLTEELLSHGNTETALNLFNETIKKADSFSFVNPAEKEKYRNNSNASFIMEFQRRIEKSKNEEPLYTGFKILDKLLDTGLYTGLYMIGAAPSIGKTTLCMQIADNLAMQGKDVLIFSFEMSRMDLMARSISRESYEICLKQNLSPNLAKTSKGISDGRRYAGYSDNENDLIQAAFNKYYSYADRVYVQEAAGMTAADIEKLVNRHIQLTGNVPVVIVDYLQIVAPVDYRMSDKQKVDAVVTSLKNISTKSDTTVIAISSLNREAYSNRVSFEAFKESGGIEYGGDVVIGLELEDVEKTEGTQNSKKKDRKLLDDAKAEKIRRITLRILKQRAGACNIPILFYYYTLFNYFEEIAETTETE